MNEQKELQTIPPQNIEAEQSFLGSILLDKNALIKVGELLHPDDFYKDSHKIIFETMLELFNKREPIDILTISNQLEENQKLDQIGGRTYLSTLLNIVPTASHIVKYAHIIQKKATLRRLISAASNISQIAFDESTDTEKLLDEAEQQLFSVSQQHLKKNFTNIKDVLFDTFERIDDLHKNKGKIRGLPTGFVELDKLLAGFQNSDLIILAARPSVGKTSLALDFARQTAIKNNIPVGIFSLEMSKEQLVDRMLCSQAGVDLWKMRTGNLSDNPNDDDFPKIGHAMGQLSEAKIFIDDTSFANVMEVRTKARRLQMEQGLGMLVIDYLQLMEGRSKENRVQEISEISRGLKGLAKELNIPILALSQLSRAVENRNPPIPNLSDLRESGAIEQDADVVLFIYREDRHKQVDADKTNIAEIIIAKHRNGPVGKISLYFNDATASFKNLAFHQTMPSTPTSEKTEPALTPELPPNPTF